MRFFIAVLFVLFFFAGNVDAGCKGAGLGFGKGRVKNLLSKIIHRRDGGNAMAYSMTTTTTVQSVPLRQMPAAPVKK